jgi:hypothetical protein
MSENRVLRISSVTVKQEVTEAWKKLYNEGVRNCTLSLQRCYGEDVAVRLVEVTYTGRTYVKYDKCI